MNKMLCNAMCVMQGWRWGRLAAVGMLALARLAFSTGPVQAESAGGGMAFSLPAGPKSAGVALFHEAAPLDAKAAGGERVFVAAPEAVSLLAGSNEPVTLAQVPVAEGVSEDLVFERARVFAEGARVVLMTEDGTEHVPLPATAYFSGRSRETGELRAFMAVEEGARVSMQLLTAGHSMRVLYPAEDAKHTGVHRLHEANAPRPSGSYCEMEVLPENQETLDMLRTMPEPAMAKSGQTLEARVMVDVSHSLYTHAFGGSTAAATAYVTSLFGAVSAVYQRDADVMITLQGINVWTTPDPFESASSTEQLNKYTAYVRSNRAPGYLNHLLDNLAYGGGIAWLDTLCRTDGRASAVSNIYGSGTFGPNAYSWDLDVVAHEMGHNFGSPHTHCYSPPIDCCFVSECGCGPQTSLPGTVMSYCHMTAGGKSIDFHARVQARIRAAAEAASCVTPVVTAAADLAVGEIVLFDAPNDGANVVTQPAVGQQVYPAVRYTYTGSSPFTGKIWRMTLNGSELCSFTGTLNAAGNFIGRCTTPWTVTSGAHQLCAYLDPDNTLNETREDNNSRCASYSVGGAADLAVTEVVLLDAPTAGGSVVSNPRAGDQVYPAVRYTYTGNAPFTGKVWRMTINGNEVCSFTGTVSAAGDFTGRCTAAWTVTPGTHQICVYLDPDNILNEAREDNNSRCASYTVASTVKTVEINRVVRYGNCWNESGTVSVPGALRMRLVLRAVDIEAGQDELRASTGNRFSGQHQELHTGWAPGDSITLTMVSDEAVSGSFTIARAEYESSESKSAGTSGKLFTENRDKCVTGGPGTVVRDDSGPQGWAGAAMMPMHVREEVLPPSVRIDPNATVSPLDALALRLTADQAIDESSIWTTLSGPAEADYDVVWRFTGDSVDNDGWVVFFPLVVLAEGSVVTLTAGAQTVDGQRLPEVSESFVIAPSKAVHQSQPALRNAPEMHALPGYLAAPHSPVYRLAPAGVYLEPVTVQLPVPRNHEAASLEIYYYSESGEQTGWYRGSEVEGWLVPGSRRVVEEGGVRYLEFQVNHAGVIQLGQATQLQMGSLGSVEFGASGSGSRWASLFTTVLGLMLLLGYAQQRQTVRASGNPQD